MPRYFGLLEAAHMVMVLTTQDNTLQWGAVEAVSLGRPVIASGWPALREVFQRGAVFVENTADSIVAGIGQAQGRLGELAADAESLHRQLEEEWRTKRNLLRTIIEGESRSMRGWAEGADAGRGEEWA